MIGRISYEAFNQLSDEVALRHSGAEAIEDCSSLTKIAESLGTTDPNEMFAVYARDFIESLNSKVLYSSQNDYINVPIWYITNANIHANAVL